MKFDALTLDDIQKMETIHQGQYDDLKYEDFGHRIWLSRVEDNLAEIESFDGDRWSVTKTIRS